LNEGQLNLNDSQQRRPSFAEDFPRAAELDALVEAFARGDYAQVRSAGGELAARSEDESVRRAARVLIERTEPDRLALGLLALAGALLVVLSAWWILNGKPPAPPAPPRVEHVH
jgi:hypothetical protein